MNNKQDKGFTLVELLIVIVILGILATVTVFAVRGITDKGQENACSTDRRTVETALEAYYAQEGSTTAPTMDLLVSEDFLVAPSTNYAIDPGADAGDASVSVISTSECAQFEGGTTPAPEAPGT
jgi:prepilin-type N-terminal cleavage/methylation domain-containing protein